MENYYLKLIFILCGKLQKEPLKTWLRFLKVLINKGNLIERSFINNCA